MIIMLRKDREEYKLLRKFVEEQVLSFKKVRYIPARDLSLIYLFGEYKAPEKKEVKLVDSLSRQVAFALHDLMEIYPKNITKHSSRIYKFTPVKEE